MDKLARRLLCAVFAFIGVLGSAAGARAPAGAGLEQRVRDFALQGTAAAEGLRVEVEVGELDARLRLAPCEQIEPYLPGSARLWGRTRVGLRCLRGVKRWNVFVPVTVRVYGQALVAGAALPAGSVLADRDLATAEVELTEAGGGAIVQPRLAVGRTLARPLARGQSLRQSHLRARQWFAAGDTVKVVAQGKGFSVAGEARAVTRGLEGQIARVRTESGRVLAGWPVGERRIEVKL